MKEKKTRDQYMLAITSYFFPCMGTNAACNWWADGWAKAELSFCWDLKGNSNLHLPYRFGKAKLLHTTTSLQSMKE